MTTLRADNVSFAYTRTPVVDRATIEVRAGEIVGVIGPNGSGKSTLLRILAGLRSPSGGSVTIDGEPLRRMPPRERARTVGFLPQSPDAPPGVCVRELVWMGRAPHIRRFAPPTQDDRDAVELALQDCDLTGLADRPLSALSGGERQRAWLALTLAQRTPAVLLDEPITALDIGHQLAALSLVRRIARERTLAVAMVLHDLDLAAQSCDRLVAMRDGRVIAEGTPESVLTPETCHELFGVRPDPTSPGGRTRCVFSVERLGPSPSAGPGANDQRIVSSS